MRKTSWISLGVCLCGLLGMEFLGLAQTLRVDGNRVAVGSLVKVPVVLNSAPQGLERFKITLSVTNTSAIAVESVIFPGPWLREGAWAIEFGGDVVEISSQDVDNAYRIGATEVLLAELSLRGTARGTTSIQVTVDQLLDDNETSFHVATAAATVDVVGGPEPSQVGLVGGSDGIPVDALSATPIILTHAPRGLASYRVTVTLAEGEVADIEGVDFESFGDGAQFEISSNRDSISFSAQDGQNVIGPGDVGVILARVRIRGRLLGTTSLVVTANRLEDDNGSSVSPAVENGIFTVGARLDVAPEFSDFHPQGFAILGDTQPTLSVDVRDVGSGLQPSSLTLEINDRLNRRSFRLGDAGVSWDGTVFRVSLAQAGVSLAAGRVDVSITARDQGGHFGFAIWQFTVTGGGGGEPGGKTIAEALDANGNGRLDDAEIVVAITLWITGTPVPGTGQLISDQEIKMLIQLWVTGGSV